MLPTCSHDRSSLRGRIVPACVVYFTALSLVGPAGCGRSGPYRGSLYPVKGQVLLADGKPLPGGTVQFIPKDGGLPASGRIEEDGTFTLRSKTGEGGAPGEYKVRIEPSRAACPQRQGGSKAAIRLEVSRVRRGDRINGDSQSRGNTT